MTNHTQPHQPSAAHPPTSADPHPNVRVIIADDHPQISAAIHNLLEQADGIEVVAVVDNAEEAITAARQLKPDVAILDAKMPGDGLTAAKQLTPTDVHVIILTADDSPARRDQADKAGVDRFLLKADSDDLAQTVLDITKQTR